MMSQYVLLKDRPMGTHALTMQGVVGALQTEWTFPSQCSSHDLALIGHPHSLQGGTMNNKVVTTLSRLFSDRGMASVRFNFRGVGASDGTYDQGVGESEDMMLLAQTWLNEHPDARLWFAGFSFGSYVAYRAAAQMPHAALITVAPSVQHYDYDAFAPQPSPWLIAHGDQDEIVPYSAVVDFLLPFGKAITLLSFENTGHFFHGMLIPLKARLTEALSPF